MPDRKKSRNFFPGESGSKCRFIFPGSIYRLSICMQHFFHIGDLFFHALKSRDIRGDVHIGEVGVADWIEGDARAFRYKVIVRLHNDPTGELFGQNIKLLYTLYIKIQAVCFLCFPIIFPVIRKSNLIFSQKRVSY